MSKKTVHLTADLFRAVILLSIVGTLATIARAQCFGSFANLVAAASARGTAKASPQSARAKEEEPNFAPTRSTADNAANPSIVGFWHVHYIFPNMDQEAYQAFETGGTEIHNPNTPTDGVCLGAWAAAPGNLVRLTHRVWLYDNGNFVGVGHLNVSIRLGDKGDTQTGTFTMTIYDLSGNPITPPIPGTLSGERITPN
ncbi:MAG TPA: hypothetical protein VHL50_09480 [Pyrinomonadaceae bacterium]|nr:hypothetical protein [Pyrinomonadaceae bacterium]